MCHRDVLACILSLCYLHSVTICRYALIWRKLKPESAIRQLSWLCMSVIPQLSWLCMSAIPGKVTGSCTLWSSPSTSYNFAEYLVLDDGGYLNSLLSADFIPYTWNHLFWDWNLESCLSALRLEVISGRFSHHHNFWEYINVPWLMDSSKCSTSTHLFTLVRSHYVPWFPFSLLVGYIVSVNDLH